MAQSRQDPSPERSQDEIQKCIIALETLLFCGEPPGPLNLIGKRRMLWV